MATIASLAFKVSANIADLTKDINTVTGSIGSMARQVQNATPNMRSLGDAANGYGIVLDAVKKAQDRFDNSTAENMLENQKILTDTTAAADALKKRLGNIGEGVAGDILKMEPTIKNIGKAQKQLEEMKRIAEATGQTELFAGPIAEATKNIEELTSKTIEAQTAMASFDGVIKGFQNLPFLILMEVLKSLKTWLFEIAETLDAKYMGIPSLVLKTVAAVTALVIVIGIMNTQMVGLLSTTSVWMGMWKASVIYRGLVGVIGLLNVVLGTQIAITTASLIWVSVITLGLAAVIAAVIALVSWWYAAAEATDTAAERTKQLQETTEAYKNSLKGTVDEHKKILDVVNKIREASKNPAQKAADKQTELQSAIAEPRKLQERINALQAEIENRKKLIANTKDKEQLEALKERNAEAVKTLNDLNDMQSKLKPLTGGEIEAREKAILAEEMKDRDLDKYMPQITAAQELERARGEIAALYESGKIDSDKRASLLEHAQLAFEKNDEATQLAKKYFDASDTLANRQSSLADIYSKLEEYAQRGGLADDALIEAKQKAAREILRQSEHGKLLADAMEAVRPATERLKEAFAAIDAEAAVARENGLAITEEAIEKAKQMVEEKIVGKAEGGRPEEMKKKAEERPRIILDLFGDFNLGDLAKIGIV